MYAEAQRLEKRVSFWEEGLSSLPECEWAVAESQRGMKQDEVKIVCRGATPWKMGIFLREKVELFTGGWVSWCWVRKRDDAENEKNDYKTGKGNRKGKYKPLVRFNLMYSFVPNCRRETRMGSDKIHQGKIIKTSSNGKACF